MVASGRALKVWTDGSCEHPGSRVDEKGRGQRVHRRRLHPQVPGIPSRTSSATTSSSSSRATNPSNAASRLSFGDREKGQPRGLTERVHSDVQARTRRDGDHGWRPAGFRCLGDSRPGEPCGQKWW